MDNTDSERKFKSAGDVYGHYAREEYTAAAHMSKLALVAVIVSAVSMLLVLLLD